MLVLTLEQVLMLVLIVVLVRHWVYVEAIVALVVSLGLSLWLPWRSG